VPGGLGVPTAKYAERKAPRVHSQSSIQGRMHLTRSKRSMLTEEAGRQVPTPKRKKLNGEINAGRGSGSRPRYRPRLPRCQAKTLLRAASLIARTAGCFNRRSTEIA